MFSNSDHDPDENHDGKRGDWIALNRKVRDHPIVGCGKNVAPVDPSRGSWNRFEAWFDLLCLAQFKASRINNRGQVMTLDVGQLLGARAWLAARWNWTEKTVRCFLDVLEAEGMISRGTGREQGHQITKRRSYLANIITISNYSHYQQLSEGISGYLQGRQGPAQGQLRATRRATNPAEKGHHKIADKYVGSTGYNGNAEEKGHQLSEKGPPPLAKKGHNLTSNNTSKNNPLPPDGGVGSQIDLEEAVAAKVDAMASARVAESIAEAVATAVAQVKDAAASSTPKTTSLKPDLSVRAKRAAERRKHTEAQTAEATLAVHAYNIAADEHGYQACDTIPPSRMTRLIKRIADLGGLASFEAAVRAIPTSQFLSGKVKGRDGQPPFRLTFDRLLQTKGNMGDVLANLLAAAQAPLDPAKAAAPNGRLYGWWLGREGQLRDTTDQEWADGFKKHPPGDVWPWWYFGPAPGDPDCLVPAHIVAQHGWAEKYRGSITGQLRVAPNPSTATGDRPCIERISYVG